MAVRFLKLSQNSLAGSPGIHVRRMSPLGVRQWNHASVSAVGMDFCSFRAIGAGRIGGNRL
ncbi:hypothetical protein, partial [Enterococcus faecium]|uniref:hypothetical protein n=1 Tax=Enterococcus faecium TaxID=1352 RepID=UPI001E2C56FC